MSWRELLPVLPVLALACCAEPPLPGRCAALHDPTARLACYDRNAEGPRLQPVPRAAESCTRAEPCTGPRGGQYYIGADGRRVSLPRR